ncbi:hypothetical protein K08M3_49720 [Vibrio alginolyticus]|jgi:hypothetical protein|uniref:Uncharacterized protein n=1 Tax=Vibrio alginolyticus TaxID=663 RepID=A0A1W6TLD0_VIBAL|nr:MULTISPECIES: hypothetical protein [Vibrio harveyi group]ARP06482.1 hypothetical protein K04M1_49590 [Vibrio alginolyticus]ARP11587.1 hypothetical protein K04M3_50180 [Vibrio alginolyticus]ARP16668.1 hypothetical protein K04M5_50160 [Vibrio alginolyticus]ARP21687.1 hypothetical protein K05K4_49780 [Vibrio alginolyticus]ARP26768.1 hypothetical protein K06K5_49680 [Vibrio alginolyticus]
MIKGTLISQAMCSSLENYIKEVVDSIEFDIERKLTDAEYNSVANQVTLAIEQITNEFNFKLV